MIDTQIAPTLSALAPKVRRMFDSPPRKIRSIKSLGAGGRPPVFTAGGRYTSRGWTEWTQGFQFGSAILQFDATGDTEFLEIGRERTVAVMAPHVSHIGVHDHGFNNVSTYGNLLRLMNEGRIPENTVGAPLLRDGAEMLGRGAGGALVADGGWRRLHLLVQRAAFAVRGHDPYPARAGW